MFKKQRIGFRRYCATISTGALFSSCIFSGNFPLSIDDIDTTTIYNRYKDSIHSLQSKTDNDTLSKVIADTVIISSPTIQEPVTITGKWAVCIGAFSLKENATLTFQNLPKEDKSLIIIRKKLYFVTTGLFDTRDSAKQFKSRKKFPANNYIVKILPDDQLIEISE